MMKFIYWLTMSRSKKMIIQKYGRDFWDKFKSGSDKLFREVLKETPDIGESVFSFNYAYAPSYVAWYKTMWELSLTAEQAAELIGNYEIVKAPIALKALPYCNICCLTGDELKDCLNGYLSVLCDMNPQSVGGKLPDDGLYYAAEK